MRINIFIPMSTLLLKTIAENSGWEPEEKD